MGAMDVFRAASEELEAVLEQCRKNRDGNDLVDSVVRVLRGYLADEYDPDADFSLLVAQALSTAAGLAEDLGFGDRTVADRLERRINALVREPVVVSEARIAVDAARDDPARPSRRLRELCATGLRLHGLQVETTLAAEVIGIAEERCDVEALVAAVSVREARIWQLGLRAPVARQTFAALGRLARSTDPQVSEAAVGGLVELCAHSATMVPAALHLPADQLTDEQFGFLVDVVEHTENELLPITTSDTFLLPIKTLRAALWLAIDARRIDDLHERWNRIFT